MSKFALALHGGAGTLTKASLTPELEMRYLNGLELALNAGVAILEKGGSSQDAVMATVVELENSPLFNAGRGAVFTADGTHEMDASIMLGEDLSAGAIAGVTGIKNPILLANKVRTHSGHVFLTGEGALNFAREVNVEFANKDWFYDELRYKQWQAIKGSDVTQLDHTPPTDEKFGTVGAVALDKQGNIAAATSTGGMTNKKYGRVGDSPIIGAGTYANNATCAVSCTG